jgi:3-dehydroquinate synthase
MGDIQIYNFKIKSIIHDYIVQFIHDFAQTLGSELRDGDFLIIDNKIKNLYPDDLAPFLDKYRTICIDANEQQKSYEGVIPLIQSLINEGFRKNHRLVAIGGGITQDITAFIASIMYRGVKWIYFPTTLLAQGDSCIGSKTSINFGEYKNQVGGFYPPRKIFIYPEFLASLSENELRSGMGEMLHYFIVSGEEDFRMYESNFKEAFFEKSVLAKIIVKSLSIKKQYIERDEFDQNIRQVFNYGHSFGHAIESLTKYRIPHGIAVSFGMDMANYISVKMGLIDDVVRDEIRDITKVIWKGHSLRGIDVQTFIKALSKDKKNVGTQLGLILNKGYGRIFKQLVRADDTFVNWVKDYFEHELEQENNS